MKNALATAFVGFLSSVASTASAVEILFAIPDFRDPPTETFIETLLTNESLSEADIFLNVIPYSALGGLELVLEGPVREGAVALMATDFLQAAASRSELEVAADMLAAYERSLFGIAPGDTAQQALEPIRLGATAVLGELQLVGLATWPSAPSSVFLSQPLNDVSDFAGLRVRSVEGVTTERLTQIGAAPTSFPPGEVIEGLQTGAIDAAEVLSLPESQLQTLYQASSDGVLYTDASARTGFFVIGYSGIDALSARQLGVLEDAAQSASFAALETVEIAYRAALQEAQEFDVQFASLASLIPDEFTLAEQVARAYGLSVEDIRALGLDLSNPATSAASVAAAQDVSQNGGTRAPHIFVATPRNDEGDADLRLRFGNRMDASSPLTCFRLDYTRDMSRRFGEPYEGAVEVNSGDLFTGPADCTRRIFHGSEESSQLTILIHGFNNSFEDAVNWAVAAVEDLAIEGEVVLWSWPSMGQVSGYVRDRDGIDFNRSYIRAFLATLKLLEDSGQGIDISIVAHSMGGLVAMDVVRFLAEPPSLAVSNVVLVAPDVRGFYFEQTVELGREISPLWSIYANSNDVALIASIGVNQNFPIGLGGRNRFLLPGVDTIDVSDLDRNRCPIWYWRPQICNNHTHAFDVQAVAEDLSQHLMSRETATERRLTEMFDSDGSRYFEIGAR